MKLNKNKILKLHNSGKSIKEIAAIMDCSGITIYNNLRKLGISFKRPEFEPGKKYETKMGYALEYVSTFFG